MISPLFYNGELNILHAIRSRSIDCKVSFRNKYRNDDLLCDLCRVEEDDQPNILLCKLLNSKVTSDELVEEPVEYNDVFKEPLKQKVFITMYKKLLEIRKKLIEESDPSTPTMALETSYNLPRIVNFSSGN